MNYTIRAISPEEYDTLADFLYDAIFVPTGIAPPPRTIIESPELQAYIKAFGKEKDDCCLVAAVEGRIVGAIWSRIMKDYGHIDDATPSLAMSVIGECRKLGIGTSLLNAMLTLLQEKGYARVSLSVQKANYALKMYTKAGFIPVTDNGEEYVMAAELCQRA